MVSFEPKSVGLLACWPLLHYAFRVEKRTCRHTAISKPYRAVRPYCGIRSARAAATRARGLLAHHVINWKQHVRCEAMLARASYSTPYS